MSIDQEKLIEIARECGAVIDVLCMGRHDNVVFTSGEIQRFVQRIEQPYVDTIEDLHDEIGRLREALQQYTDGWNFFCTHRQGDSELEAYYKLVGDELFYKFNRKKEEQTK